MKQVTLRLYRQHDMDLILLYRMKKFKFQTQLKRALRAYSLGNEYVIERPDEPVEVGYIPKYMTMHIYLREGKDDEAIKTLSTIKNGFRCAFLKALFRSYMNTSPLEAYRDDTGMEMTQESKGKTCVEKKLTPYPAIRKGLGERDAYAGSSTDQVSDNGKKSTTKSEKKNSTQAVAVDFTQDKPKQSKKKNSGPAPMPVSMSINEIIINKSIEEQNEESLQTQEYSQDNQETEEADIFTDGQNVASTDSPKYTDDELQKMLAGFDAIAH